MPYKINQNTLALIPIDKKTKVLETKEFLIVDATAVDIVAGNCIMSGSTLEGRQRGSAVLLGSNCKPPIVVDNERNIILIPTNSSRNKNCVWINLSGVLYYRKNIKNGTTITFTNKQKINLNISYAVFDRQVLRATRLESTIRGRNLQNSL